MIYAIIAAILLILIFILFAPLRVELYFNQSKLKVKVFLSGVKVFGINFGKKGKNSTEKKPEKEKTTEEKVKKLEKDCMSLSEKIDYYSNLFNTAVKLLRKYVGIKNLSVRIEAGTGEAPSTAICVGVLWGLVYSLLGTIGSVIYIDNHNVEITPKYEGAVFSADGKCIIKSTIAYIIFIAITILMKLKSRKGKEE